MKKLFVPICLLFLITGCGNSGVGEEITCQIDGKETIFTLKDGIVTKFTYDGVNASKLDIDELNGEYFATATNNEEGKEALNNYIKSVNGTCE